VCIPKTSSWSIAIQSELNFRISEEQTETIESNYSYVILRVTLKNCSTKVIDRHHYPSYTPHVARHLNLGRGNFFHLAIRDRLLFIFAFTFLLSLSLPSSRKLRQNLCDNRHLESSLLLSYRVTHFPRVLEENRPPTNFTSDTERHFLSTFSFVLVL